MLGSLKKRYIIWGSKSFIMLHETGKCIHLLKAPFTILISRFKLRCKSSDGWREAYILFTHILSVEMVIGSDRANGFQLF